MASWLCTRAVEWLGSDVPGMPGLVSEDTELPRAVVSAPFRAYRHDLSFSQLSAWASQQMEKGLRLVADFAYMRVGPHCISAQPHGRAYSVGITGVYCFHLAALLNSLLEVSHQQFLQGWLILVLDSPFSCACGLSTCMPFPSVLVILSCTAGIFTGWPLLEEWGWERDTLPGVLSSDTLPARPFSERVWQT